MNHSIPLKFFLVVLIAFTTHPVFAQTHCTKDEFDYFSCQIKGSSKVASFCGAKQENETLKDSWIQYRFGRIGKPELIYPLSKVNSLDKFENNYFHPREEDHQVIDIRFINEKALYSVSLVDSYRHGESHITGSVSALNNHKNTELFCNKEIEYGYWDSLLRMPASTPSNETDIANKYYKENVK